MKKKLIFTGGGSGGHVIPALTLIKKLQEHDIYYIGSESGIERKLALENNLRYKSIFTGKLRRYISIQNFIDVFKVFIGVIQSFFYLLQFKKSETVIIATGGFVIVPVVIAAFLQRKKIIIHEQTSRVGLANKIASYMADTVLVTFKDSVKFFPSNKVNHVGYPLREEIFNDNTVEFIKDRLLKDIEKPILFVTGGGNGSQVLNQAIEEVRHLLMKDYFIVHQVGKKHFDAYIGYETKNYKVYDFVGDEMVTLLKKADIIISRSGAGTVVELMALGKPSIYVPLKIAQKNEQYYNAKQAERIMGSIVIEEGDLNGNKLLDSIEKIKEVPKINPASFNPVNEICRIIVE